MATTGQQRANEVGRSLVGTPAPQLVLETIDGDTIDLGQLYGKKGLYLKFWATWCVPCREQMPHLEKTFEDAGDDLAVIAVDAGFIDTIADVRAVRDEFGLTMPIAIDDGRLADALKPAGHAAATVIGRDGRVLYVGHLADGRLEDALAEAKQPVAARVASVRRRGRGAHHQCRRCGRSVRGDDARRDGISFAGCACRAADGFRVSLAVVRRLSGEEPPGGFSELPRRARAGRGTRERS
jgi:thiol-disulfide isomerase/thioredoxin